MIHFLKGTLTLKMPTWIEMDVNNIGYGLTIPLSTFDNLPEENEQISLFTHLYVKEDILALYGFSTRQEKEMFLMLLKISGIGPKAAIAIESSLSNNQIRNAVITQDVKILSSVPGIGKKTAERIILDLKDKLSKKYNLSSSGTQTKEIPEIESDSNDAIKALITLGYNSNHAVKAVNTVVKNGFEGKIEQLIKEALKIRG